MNTFHLLVLGLVGCGAPTPGVKNEHRDTRDSDPSYDSDDSDSEPDTEDSQPDSDDSETPSACLSSCDCEVGLLCYDGVCAQAGPALDAYRGGIERLVAQMDPLLGSFPTESAYPAEVAMTLASASWLLCDETLAAAARTRASFAQSWENADHLLVWSGYPTITRDYNARHIYDLWATGQALDDPELLAAADATAIALIGLERLKHGDFTLLCNVYETTPPYDCVSDFTWIDVNQNSELGLAFALLYSDPGSALYHDPTALDIIENELGAAISLQDPTTGAIPIGEFHYIDDFDTLYGGYSAWSWALSNSVLPSLALEEPLALAAAWLAPYSGSEPTTHRTYPYVYDTTMYMMEGPMRMPVLHGAGLLEPAFMEAFWTVIQPADTETCLYYLPFWLTLQAGMPLELLLPRAAMKDEG